MEPHDSEGPSNLLETEAAARAKQISNVTYTLALNVGVPDQKDRYTGELTITLSYEELVDVEPFLDFTGKSMESFVVNGTAVTENSWRQHRLYLGGLLKKGDNELKINYTNLYDHDGDGFHQFIDPEDKEEYLYTNLEPASCKRVFPCFDQPDIKASYSLTVTAPSAWEVIANDVSESVVEKDARKTHTFKTTPKFSTYLFAIVAGPYESFHDNFEDRIPLGIYVRKSYAKYVDDKVLFQETKQGIAFYEQFFDCKYPFSKLDSSFVPEYNAGAMENVGCVTYTEYYLHKDPPTQSQLANRCDTFLHELAHMWFGNLISPVWWDALWLNESFATYMAALCVSEATEYKKLSWLNFATAMKSWAYREDQLVTTHPVQGEVVDTEATFANFDGLTYGKGASLLKQLVYRVGMDNFKKGMQYYFKTYAWGNTTLAQFLDALTHADSSLSASDWAAEWLQTSGMNSIQLSLDRDADGVVKSASVKQGIVSAEHSTMREQKVLVVVYEEKDGGVVQTKQFPFLILAQESTPMPELEGSVVEFAFLNYDDNGYGKFLLDPVSQSFVLKNMEKFEDALLRQQLWNIFYSQTRDASLPSDQYLQLVHSKLLFEVSPKLIQSVGRRASAVLHNFIPEALFEREAEKLFQSAFTTWKAIDSSKEEEKKEHAIVWSRMTIGFAQSLSSVKLLVEELKADHPDLSQTMRWTIVQKAFSWGLEEAETLKEAEAKKDGSDVGQRSLLTCATSVATEEVKKAAWERYIVEESKQSLFQFEADMSGFYWHHQKKLLAPYRDLFFEHVREVFKKQTPEWSTQFYRALFPQDPEDEVVSTKAKALIALLDPAKESRLIRALKESVDDLDRSKKCRDMVQQ